LHGIGLEWSRSVKHFQRAETCSSTARHRNFKDAIGLYNVVSHH
jgi:hypothetical protein